MKCLYGILTGSLLLTVAACTDTQLASTQHYLSNFNAGVASVDESIKALSSTLYANCKNIQVVSQTASDLTGSCSKAGSVVSAGNAAINSLCQASQVTDVTSTVVASGAAYQAVRTQLASAKKSCGG